MSHFYGTLKGDRGEVTRRGTKASGLMASAQSWNGSITVAFKEWPSGTRVEIMASTNSSTGGRMLWSGLLSELLHDDAEFRVKRLTLTPQPPGGVGGAK